MEKKKNTRIQYRYITCFVTFFNLLMFYFVRTSVSVGVLAMVKRNTHGNETTNPAPCLNSLSINTSIQSGIFEWDDAQQGVILSSYFFGYILTHFAGSVLAEKFGIRIIHSISIAGTAFFSFMMVPMAYAGADAFIGSRFLIGFFGGPLYPIIHLILGHWAPLHERTILTVITHAGNIMGLVVTFGIGGAIVNVGPKGWEYLYYFSGALGVVNLILWLIFGYDYPEDHPFISDEEVKLIQKSLYPNGIPDRKNSFKKIPFKDLFSSPQIYIQSLAMAGNNFIIYAYLTGHPKFLSDIYGLSPNLSSYYSMIAFVCNFVCQVSYSFLTDFIRQKNYLPITTIRRINSGIGFIGAATFLIPVGFLGCGNFGGVIALLALGFSMLSINQAGFFTAMIDLSPKYGGLIMGIANTLGSVAGIVQPQIVGRFITDQGASLGWRNAFVVTACISVILGLPFIIFGSSKRRKWADGNFSKIKENSEIETKNDDQLDSPI